MPGYSIHLAVAKENYNNHKDKLGIEEEFEMGTIAPDRVSDKEVTHYGDSGSPGLDAFLDDHSVDNSYDKGFFLHLLTDYYFYNKFFKNFVWSPKLYDDYDRLNKKLTNDYTLDIPDEIKDIVQYQDGELEVLDYDALKNFIKIVGQIDIDEVVKTRDFDKYYDELLEKDEKDKNSKTFSTFLDFNEAIKVVFKVVGDSLSFDYRLKVEDDKVASIIKKNLNELSHLETTDNPDVYTLNIRDTIFIDVNIKTGEVVNVNKITAFETRSLAQGNSHKVPFSRENRPDFTPETDLHTHFAGALRADTLIDVGFKHNINYPKWALEKMGIDVSKYSFDEKGFIKLQSLSVEDILQMKEKLQISQVTQERFLDMESVYDYRGAFTKNIELFPDFLRALAEDYKKNGQKYVELSFSSFLNDRRFMEVVEKELPQIESETGVKLRFLIGLWRHSDKEWNLDETDRLIQLADSPYIVGADFMGHETNQTLEFSEEIRMLARHCMEKDPDFVIRVHAGENPLFKSNVYDALKIVKDEHDRYEAEHPEKSPIIIPQMRIGHGLYGMDIDSTTDEQGNWISLEKGAVIDLIKEMGAIIEFNMSSNLALNNINDIGDVPIKRYIGEGVKVVLGTDGHGMYSTSSSQEVLLAKAAGLNREDFEIIRETERSIQERAMHREITHPTIEDIDKLYEFRYSTEDGKARWSQTLEEQKRLDAKQKEEAIKGYIEATGAITDKEQIEKDIEGKVPFLLSSASMSSWGKISKEGQDNITLVNQVLVNCINPEKAFIITGGTNFGGEKTMHEAVRRRNLELPADKQIVLLGTFTLEALKDHEGIQPDTITHGMIMEVGGRMASGWMQLPDTQLEYTEERGGCLIAEGGGSIVSDMIQRSHNLAIPMHLMDGPKGASTDKAHSFEGNNYAFTSPQELVKRLYEQYPQAFGIDFSLEKLDDIVAKSLKELGMDEPTKGKNPISFNSIKRAVEKNNERDAV